MKLEILYETVYVSDKYYQEEVAKAFKEIEALSPERLSLELLCLEDQEQDLTDGYDSGWTKNKLTWEDQTEHLLDLWKTTIRIEHVKLRLQLHSMSTWLFNALEPREQMCDGDSDMDDGPDFGTATPPKKQDEMASLASALCATRI